MTHKKIYVLNRPNANHADATFIMGLGCEVQVITPEPVEFETSAGTRWMAQDVPYIEITTSCEKQEMMLYLKYENALHLKEIVYTEWWNSENLNLV